MQNAQFESERATYNVAEGCRHLERQFSHRFEQMQSHTARELATQATRHDALAMQVNATEERVDHHDSQITSTQHNTVALSAAIKDVRERVGRVGKERVVIMRCKQGMFAEWLVSGMKEANVAVASNTDPTLYLGGQGDVLARGLSALWQALNQHEYAQRYHKEWEKLSEAFTPWCEEDSWTADAVRSVGLVNKKARRGQSPPPAIWRLVIRDAEAGQRLRNWLLRDVSWWSSRDYVEFKEESEGEYMTNEQIWDWTRKESLVKSADLHEYQQGDDASRRKYHDERMKKAEQQIGAVDEMMQPWRPQAGSGQTCYNCGKTGHRANECPDQPICRGCGGPGHRIMECPERKCFNCGEQGHEARHCRKPQKKTEKGQKGRNKGAKGDGKGDQKGEKGYKGAPKGSKAGDKGSKGASASSSYGKGAPRHEKWSHETW
jgi:hypothetical protein